MVKRIGIITTAFYIDLKVFVFTGHTHTHIHKKNSMNSFMQLYCTFPYKNLPKRNGKKQNFKHMNLLMPQYFVRSISLSLSFSFITLLATFFKWSLWAQPSSSFINTPQKVNNKKKKINKNMSQLVVEVWQVNGKKSTNSF